MGFRRSGFREYESIRTNRLGKTKVIHLKQKIMVTELAQKFTDYKLSNEYRVKNNFVKMMVFAHENQLTNEMIDYYMNCPPRRMEDESYEAMKIRTHFANKLVKYRAYLYDYSEYLNK